jgi:hypothetical protein
MWLFMMPSATFQRPDTPEMPKNRPHNDKPGRISISELRITDTFVISISWLV